MISKATERRQGVPLRPDWASYRERGTMEAMATLTRSVLVAANSKLNPNEVTASFVRRHWGDGELERIAPVLRAASAPATTSQPGWAAELAQTTTLAFLANLVPLSAGADLLSRALSLSFDGAAVINIPNVSTPVCDFVGQGAPIPVVSGTSGVQASLSPAKLAAIVVVTSELLASSNAEALVRQALLDAVAPSLDRRLFDTNAAVADLRPAGLLYNKVALTASTDADRVTAMIEDLSALAAAVSAYAGNGGLAFIAAPKQAVAASIGLLNFPYPLLTSTSLAAGTVICVATNAVVSALGAVQIDLTKAASLNLDTAPAAIAAGGVMPSPTVVTFQNDTVGVRLRWPISWALRNSAAIAFVSGVTW